MVCSGRRRRRRHSKTKEILPPPQGRCQTKRPTYPAYSILQYWLGKGNVALTYYILRLSNLGFHHFPAASMEYTGIDLGALVRIVFLQIAETSCIR